MTNNKLQTYSNCPFCNSSKLSKYDRLENWSISRCKKCGYTFTNPSPYPEDLPKYYEESYFHDVRHSSKFYNQDNSIKESDKTEYLNRIIEIENCFIERGSLLEIGAAHGDFLKTMKSLGWDVSGVEISKDGCNIAKNKNNIEIYNGNYLDFKTSRKYDVICLYQTLEHVYNPKEHIKKAFDELSNNGILLIEVPNRKSFDMKISKKRKWLSYDLPRHLSHFDPKFLSIQLKKVGFEIENIDLYYPNFIIKLIQRIKKEKPISTTSNNSTNENEAKPRPLYKKHQNFNSKILSTISKFFPGWRFTIIARKVENEN